MYGYSPIYSSYGYVAARSCPWPRSKVELNQKFRALWAQHIYWTRLAVNSIAGSLPDLQPTLNRLLRNPDDFAAVLTPFYGTANASEFARLFREHLTIAAELVQLLKAGNTQAAADAQKRWYANADAIAVFLARINPFWSQKEWQRMMYEHLKLLTEEVAARLSGNYTENVATNDRIEPQAYEMADVMTEGVVRQFPSAFQV
ncbi:acetylglutamate kinase [Paenibacillus sp. HN-1]|uniref:acetylglutamate kinase n=1 Tax=Paenibacillus TaxID=44249 RepID=UPI001CA9AA76|nr:MULTISPECIES: acetylglutamate kinase [Paenibacillus]MBY9078253.1 acetylglutamate kinase [Paenibacillus sp. CGMCC 1.18879]MBY9086088.1 acetylglutamate kinase [Paenibacillus sinensis]